MSKLVTEVRNLSNGYVRKGGKINRRQQRQRMLAFASFCENEGALYLDQVGGRHVVRYWKSEPMLELSDNTRMAHYRALVKLWELAEKNGGPPLPFLKQKIEDES